MGTNPYAAPVEPTEISGDLFSEGSDEHPRFPVFAKVLLCIVGIALFASNPWRDLWFYESIAAHEGFGTTTDTYIVGFAMQLVATHVLLPVAIFLIAFGIGRSKRFSVIPRFDLFTWGWGVFASIAAFLMIGIEFDYLIYGIRHAHHTKTVLISCTYIAFIYIWWCCSLAHRRTIRNYYIP